MGTEDHSSFIEEPAKEVSFPCIVRQNSILNEEEKCNFLKYFEVTYNYQIKYHYI